jgi:hypothetical protein
MAPIRQKHFEGNDEQDSRSFEEGGTGKAGAIAE